MRSFNYTTSGEDRAVEYCLAGEADAEDQVYCVDAVMRLDAELLEANNKIDELEETVRQMERQILNLRDQLEQ
jgi:hypothetical protein